MEPATFSLAIIIFECVVSSDDINSNTGFHSDSEKVNKQVKQYGSLPAATQMVATLAD